MPGQLLKPTKGTSLDTTRVAGVWADEQLEDHLRELDCACKDRTPGSLMSVDNRREKRKVASSEARMTRKMEEFERKMLSVPKAKTL